MHKILLFVALCVTQHINAQDMHFTQFYSSAASLHLNPAFAGVRTCSRVSTTYRNQWAGVTQGYSSYLVSFDHYSKVNNIGFGFLLGKDESGSGSLSRTLINPIISYQAKLSRKLVLSFGLQPGIGISSVDFDKLLFGDQIARGGNGITTLENVPENKTYFDASGGLLLFSSSFWVGTSFHHINKPVEAFYSSLEDSRLPLKFSLHGGYRFKLKAKEKFFSLTFNYKQQNAFKQLDFAGYFTISKINFGLSYRGIPWMKTYKDGYLHNDALALLFSVKTDRLTIGYSYDTTISRLTNPSSSGAHEISLAYNFCKLSKQRGRRLKIECPSF